MSVSLRDQRVRCYAYSDAGTDGDAVPTYTFTEERWGRVAAPTGRETTAGAQAEHVADAVIALPRDAQLTPNGACRVDGQFYKVTAILDRRRPNELQVLAVIADDAAYTIVEGP